MSIRLEDLGPAARAQAEQQMHTAELRSKARKLQQSGWKRCAEFGSKLEERYYTEELLPKICAGLVAAYEAQKVFTLWPAADYCGIHMRENTYKPDFFIIYQNGQCEAVEVKSTAVRKLQREYPLKRRVFIELYAKPNGWKFTEYIVDQG